MTAAIHAAGTDESRHTRLLWTAAVVAAACAPHWTTLPAWINALLVVSLGWRLARAFLGWPQAPRWVSVAFAVAGLAAVLAQFGTLNGIEPGGALLVVMVSLKLLESSTARDFLVLVIISFFLLFASLLTQRGLGTAFYLFGAAWLATVALLKIGRETTTLPSAASLKLATRVLLQAVPFAVVLFALFPRLPGPLWGLPGGSGGGVTGLSDSMSPGDITNLGLAEGVAFRVDFAGRAPPANELYWRGPVLRDFDGRTWTRRQGMSGNERSVEHTGEPTAYRVMLEPSERGWLFALDMPVDWDRRLFDLNSDFQLTRRFGSRGARNVSSYEVTSYASYRASETLRPNQLEAYRRLPAASSPRTRALVAQWLDDDPSDAQIVERAFAYLKSQPFYYTLTPPPLGAQPVDDFLFETLEGFCEHYASAFAVMLRAAGVPARIVTGYQGGELNGFTGLHVVRQADAHAWTEVWLDNRGWVRVDPVTAVLPERVSLGSLRDSLADRRSAAFAGFRWLRNVALAWDAVQTYWSRGVVGYGPELQTALLTELGFDALRIDERLVVLGALAVAAVLVLALTLSLYLQWRARRQPAADAAARAFAAFVRRLSRARVAPRAPAEDPAAYAHRAAAVLPHAAADIDAIASAYLRARYERDGEASALAELRRRVAAFAPRRSSGNTALEPPR